MGGTGSICTKQGGSPDASPQHCEFSDKRILQNVLPNSLNILFTFINFLKLKLISDATFYSVAYIIVFSDVLLLTLHYSHYCSRIILSRDSWNQIRHEFHFVSSSESDSEGEVQKSKQADVIETARRQKLEHHYEKFIEGVLGVVLVSTIIRVVEVISRRSHLIVAKPLFYAAIPLVALDLWRAFLSSFHTSCSAYQTDFDLISLAVSDDEEDESHHSKPNGTSPMFDAHQSQDPLFLRLERFVFAILTRSIILQELGLIRLAPILIAGRLLFLVVIVHIVNDLYRKFPYSKGSSVNFHGKNEFPQVFCFPLACTSLLLIFHELKFIAHETFVVVGKSLLYLDTLADIDVMCKLCWDPTPTTHRTKPEDAEQRNEVSEIQADREMSAAEFQRSSYFRTIIFYSEELAFFFLILQKLSFISHQLFCYLTFGLWITISVIYLWSYLRRTLTTVQLDDYYVVNDYIPEATYAEDPHDSEVDCVTDEQYVREVNGKLVTIMKVSIVASEVEVMSIEGMHSIVASLFGTLTLISILLHNICPALERFCNNDRTEDHYDFVEEETELKQQEHPIHQAYRNMTNLLKFPFISSWLILTEIGFEIPVAIGEFLFYADIYFWGTMLV